ncbi:hypothetical protein K3Z80_23265, partial [Pseudomonas aeruginosa]|nr:hypothetical protein [Pseudomonas aeruginosa]
HRRNRPALLRGLPGARDAAEQADIRRRMPVVAHRRFFPPAEPRPARTE